jgi:hypothetical protein
MNRRIDFSQLGGFPATQYTFDYMQKTYSEVIGALASAYGNAVILTGCVVTGSFISSGWVSINSEILPFSGGSVTVGLTTSVVVVETRETRRFKNNEEKEVYFSRKSQIGVAIGDNGTLWSKFRRLDIDPWKTGDIKESIVTVEYLTANFDANGIGINERIGWALLDGKSGRVNATKRVSVGYDPGDPAFTPGATGGSNTQTIQQANLPAVQLDVKIPTNATSTSTSGDGNIVLGNGGPDAHPGPTLKTAPLGSGTPMSIMQSYYVTVKMIKL